MSPDEYERALAEVIEAAQIYHGGLTDSVASGDSGTVWAPIYRDLLVELAGRLQIAGHRYDQAADEVGIPDADRFDWRSYLSEG